MRGMEWAALGAGSSSLQTLTHADSMCPLSGHRPALLDQGQDHFAFFDSDLQ